MHCPRCNNRMISSKRVEEEICGPFVLYTTVSIRECVWCSVRIVAIVPKLVEVLK